MPLPLKILPGLAYAADVSTRQDAIFRLVVNERDYISAWLSTTRNLWRMLGGYGFCMTLPGNLEQRMGCDGLFVIQGVNFFKYFYFEAKRLRNGFDNLKTASDEACMEYGFPLGSGVKFSRFSDQIGRQAQWILANQDDKIAEIFLDFGELVPALPAPPFDKFGSTIVLHEDVRAWITNAGGLNPPTNVWNVPRVQAMLIPPPPTATVYSVKTLLDAVVDCDIGQKNYNTQPAGPGIPPIIINNGVVDVRRIRQFLTRLGIIHFGYFSGIFPNEEAREPILVDA